MIYVKVGVFLLGLSSIPCCDNYRLMMIMMITRMMTLSLIMLTAEMYVDCGSLPCELGSAVI